MTELKLNSCRRGAVSELTATVWLLEQGYEVYRNVSPEGPFDLVAVKPGETLFIDVKTCTPRVNYGLKCLQAQKIHKSGDKYEGFDKKVLYVYGQHVSWLLGGIPFDQHS